MISAKDRQILREVAGQQMELASTPQMQALEKAWIAHNDGTPGKPLLVIEWGTFAGEVIPPLLRCEGEEARRVEWSLYGNFVGHMLFGDDSFVTPYMPVYNATWFKPFDIDIEVDRPDSGESIGHHFKEIVTDLEDDFDKLGRSTFGVDRAATQAKLDLYEDLFGDILPVRLTGSPLYAVPTQNIVHIMSMETMLFSLYDYPELFHNMMDRLADDYLAYFRFLEQERLILPTIANEPVGNGTFAFTTELPGPDTLAQRPLTSADVWGFLDSQETTGMSPDMYHEFIFPYYKRIADVYGKLSYGCCEAVDPIWPQSLSQLSTLRKVSISPWCNEDFMGEALAGTKIIYHRKPSPNFLGVDRVLDEDAFTAHIRKTLKAAKGCTIEFTQRDVYTVHGDMDKVRAYVRIVRSLTE